MTGYSLATMRRAMSETKLDVLLTYSHGTLLDNSIHDDLQFTATRKSCGRNGWPLQAGSGQSGVYGQSVCNPKVAVCHDADRNR
jgi:hypothetical protein